MPDIGWEGAYCQTSRGSTVGHRRGAKLRTTVVRVRPLRWGATGVRNSTGTQVCKFAYLNGKCPTPVVRRSQGKRQGWQDDLQYYGQLW